MAKSNGPLISPFLLGRDLVNYGFGVNLKIGLVSLFGSMGRMIFVVC